MATLIGVMFGILILTLINKNNIPTDNEIISKNLIGNSFNKAVNKASPSVVNIYSDVLVDDRRSQFPFSDRFNSIFGRNQARIQSSLGSGVIFYSNGYILTNQHVIGDRNVGITVELPSGRKEKAKIIGIDKGTDLAVLKINQNEELSSIEIANSDNLKIGDIVLAIGNPYGLGQSVSMGIVSATGREFNNPYSDYIQTDASINQGNSGGPLFDMNGDVIGINTAIFGQAGSIGIGFSIPSNSAKIVIDQLIKYGETKRGWLGVRIQTVTKEIAEVEKLDKPRGALVASVAENSPSEKAGIKSGDIILEFNGIIINEMKELPKIVAQTQVGKTVEVKIWRNKKEITRKIKLGRLETSEDFKVQKKATKSKSSDIKSLKISVRPLNQKDIETRKLPKNTTGLVITDIQKNSPINFLNVNNIIIEAQKEKIKSKENLEKIVSDVLKSSEKTILIVIYNNQNQKRYIGVKLN